MRVLAVALLSLQVPDHEGAMGDSSCRDGVPGIYVVQSHGVLPRVFDPHLSKCPNYKNVGQSLGGMQKRKA